MAGAGKRTFIAGEVLTAAQVNDYLMDQAVMRFSGSAARAASITAPTEGMVTYLDDTDLFYVYSGSEWIRFDPAGRLPGSDGTVLSKDSSSSLGYAWVAPAGGGITIPLLAASAYTLYRFDEEFPVATYYATTNPASVSASIRFYASEGASFSTLLSTSNGYGAVTTTASAKFITMLSPVANTVIQFFEVANIPASFATVDTITTSTIYSQNGTARVLVLGGGGGGVDGSSKGAGGSGYATAFDTVLSTSNPASITVGAGGARSATTGGTGGTTTWATSGFSASAAGGSGGNGSVGGAGGSGGGEGRNFGGSNASYGGVNGEPGGLTPGNGGAGSGFQALSLGFPVSSVRATDPGPTVASPSGGIYGGGCGTRANPSSPTTTASMSGGGGAGMPTAAAGGGGGVIVLRWS